MRIEVKVPTLPESVSDATIAAWHKQKGEPVNLGDNIVDLETDKVVLEVVAPAGGILSEVRQAVGKTVKANMVLAIIEPVAADSTTVQPTATVANSSIAVATSANDSVVELNTTTEPAEETTAPTAPVSKKPSSSKLASPLRPPSSLSPSARRFAAQQPSHKTNKQEAEPTSPMIQDSRDQQNRTEMQPADSMSLASRPEKRVQMTRMRAQIAKHLLAVTQRTAMLTTFNEVNMAAIMSIRQQYRDQFEKEYHIRLGLMSFFVLACVESLKRFPVINASIDGEEIVYHDYVDIGVAVSTDRGLVVPVLREVDRMSMADVELAITQFAEKAKTGKLTLEEMQGGNFTITNGGVFGSLLSTPILNLPQCAILGMHKIEERPIVEKGQIIIRPMMYVALSYDHRLVDGKESVSFLTTIKALLEDPTRLLLKI